MHISLVQWLRYLFEEKDHEFKSFRKCYESLSIFVFISNQMYKTDTHIRKNPDTNPDSAQISRSVLHP